MFFKKDLYIPKVTAQWSRSDPKVIQNHPHIPESDPKVTRKCSYSEGFWHGWGPQGSFDPFKKSFKNQYFFNIFAFRPHQARTYTHHTCHLMLFDVEFVQIMLQSPPPYAKNGPKVTPKSIPKWPQIEPKMISKRSQGDAKMIPKGCRCDKWFQSDVILLMFLLRCGFGSLGSSGWTLLLLIFSWGWVTLLMFPMS